MPRHRSMLCAGSAFGLIACTAASAGEMRDFCPDRPGLTTPTCIVDRGHMVVETSIADWTHTKDFTSVNDTVMFAPALIRYGLTDTLEVRMSWDGYGLSDTRDRLTGSKSHENGAGDLGVSVRQNLINPDGSGFSISVLPYATLPTGSGSFSAGDWGAGVLVPISTELWKGVSLAVTPEIDAAVDADGNGRHLAFGSAVGLSFALTEKLTMSVDTQVIRDDDPSGHTTTAVAGLELAWKAMDDLQFDAGAVRGLNSDSPDWELYTGIAKRF